MLRAVDSFARDLGWFIIMAAVLAAYVSLAIISPLIGYLTRILLMAAWGLATVGAGLFVAVLQIRDDDILGAIGAVVAAGFLAIPWVAAMRAFAPTHFPPRPEQLKLW